MVQGKQRVLSDRATVAVILFQARNVMSYFGLFDWTFIIYFVIFRLKVFVYTCIKRNGNLTN